MTWWYAIASLVISVAITLPVAVLFYWPPQGVMFWVIAGSPLIAVLYAALYMRSMGAFGNAPYGIFAAWLKGGSADDAPRG